MEESVVIETDFVESGVIKYYPSGTPIYRSSYLKRTATEKFWNRSILVAYVAILIVVVFAVFSISVMEVGKLPMDSSVRADDSLGIITLSLCLLLMLFFAMFYVEQATSRYKIQVVQCKPFTRKNLYRMLCSYLLVGIVPLLIAACTTGQPVSVHILYYGFLLLSVTMSIVHVNYGNKNCQCKTCQNIKAVKLIYLDESTCVAETDKITKEFLIQHFRLSLSDEEVLYICFEDNTKVTFNETDYIQLHEGTYIIQKGPIGEVNIRYLRTNKNISAETEFNEKQLRHWLGIDNSGLIAIQCENGKMVHTFYEKTQMIKLERGSYSIRILKLVPEESDDISENETTVFLQEEIKQECSILTVD